MYTGADYSPSDNPESEIYGLDFVNDLPLGDSISSVAWTCTNAQDTQVTDPSPSTRIVLPSSISGTVVSVRLSGLLTGVKYVLQATVTTAQTNTLILYSHVTVEVVG